MAGAHKQILVRDTELLRGAVFRLLVESSWCLVGQYATPVYLGTAWAMAVCHFDLQRGSPFDLVCSGDFLCALGVPLSWRKFDVGHEIVWIGWKFCFSSFTALLPPDKAEKLLGVLRGLCERGRKVKKAAVEV